MTPTALRVLARAAQDVSAELSTQRDEQIALGDGPNIHAAMCYTVCATSFLTFARILAEAANTAEGK